MNELAKELDKAIKKEREESMNELRKKLSHAVLRPVLNEVCIDYSDGLILHEWDLGVIHHTLVFCNVCENKHLHKTVTGEK